METEQTHLCNRKKTMMGTDGTTSDDEGPLVFVGLFLCAIVFVVLPLLNMIANIIDWEERDTAAIVFMTPLWIISLIGLIVLIGGAISRFGWLKGIGLLLLGSLLIAWGILGLYLAAGGPCY